MYSKIAGQTNSNAQMRLICSSSQQKREGKSYPIVRRKGGGGGGPSGKEKLWNAGRPRKSCKDPEKIWNTHLVVHRSIFPEEGQKAVLYLHGKSFKNTTLVQLITTQIGKRKKNSRYSR